MCALLGKKFSNVHACIILHTCVTNLGDVYEAFPHHSYTLKHMNNIFVAGLNEDFVRFFLLCLV